MINEIGRTLSMTATVTVAFGIGVLGMLSLVDQTVVSGATVTVLSLIAVDLVDARRQVRTSTRAMRHLASTVANAAPPASLDEAFTTSSPGASLAGRPARDLDLVGVTLGRTIRTTLPDLKACLDAGGRIRIAVVDPESGAPREAARRHGVPDHTGIFEHRLRATLDLLRYLAAPASVGDRLQVRLIPFVPSVGLVATDRGSSHGVIAVDLYAHRPDAHEPSLTVSAARDRRWYTHFSAELDRIWSASRPILLTRSDPPVA